MWIDLNVKLWNLWQIWTSQDQCESDLGQTKILIEDSGRFMSVHLQSLGGDEITWRCGNFVTLTKKQVKNRGLDVRKFLQTFKGLSNI